MTLTIVPEIGEVGVTGFFFGKNLLFFILQAVALYTIVKRRGIHHAWLAWVPIGNLWILGCISDQYQYVTRHSIRNKRGKLLVLGILTAATAVVAAVLSLNLVRSIEEAIAQEYMTPATWLTCRSDLAVIILVGLVMCVLTVVCMVIQYMALYDLFRSCEPENAAVYLLISIFTGVGQVILLMACRNKDQGMPPRRGPAVEPDCDESVQKNLPDGTI